MARRLRTSLGTIAFGLCAIITFVSCGTSNGGAAGSAIAGPGGLCERGCDGARRCGRRHSAAPSARATPCAPLGSHVAFSGAAKSAPATPIAQPARRHVFPPITGATLRALRILVPRIWCATRRAELASAARLAPIAPARPNLSVVPPPANVSLALPTPIAEQRRPFASFEPGNAPSACRAQTAVPPLRFAGDMRCHAGCTSNAGCSADKPFCDLAAGECVSCLSAADCVAPTPFCSEGRCGECASATSCPVERPMCHDARCIECKNDKDCTPAKPTCQNDLCVVANDQLTIGFILPATVSMSRNFRKRLELGNGSR